MSIHTTEVIEIKEILPHPNADTLGIVQSHGWNVCVKLGDFQVGDLAAYIEPDSLVPDTEQFQFLKKSNKSKWNRIRVMRLRGYISMGLLVLAPQGAKEGDNVMELMGIEHYEPPVPMSTGGDNENPPIGWYPKYDVENFRRFNDILHNNEEVVVTEKIHGCNARFMWHNNRMWAGSRTNWKKEDSKNLWWQALKQNSWIQEWCQLLPDYVLYGEVYGQVQNLKYGTKAGEVKFAAFDIWQNKCWLPYDQAQHLSNGIKNFQWVPLVYKGPFDIKLIYNFAEQDSSIEGASHMREGVVIKSLEERNDAQVGRVQLKVVSNRYLSKSE